VSVSDDLAAACVPISDDGRTSQAVLGSASISNEGTTFGGAAYGDMIDTLRRLLATTAGARPDLGTIREITTSFQSAAESLQRFTVAEPEQVYARRIDLAGRGQATWPMISVDGGKLDRDRSHCRNCAGASAGLSTASICWPLACSE
jgi:hypothetical protein